MGHGGAREGAGRNKGGKNKDKQAVADLLEEMNCDPFAGMAEIAKMARDQGDFGIAVTCYKELAKYTKPQLKAIEHTGTDGGPIDHRVDVEIHGI